MPGTGTSPVEILRNTLVFQIERAALAQLRPRIPGCSFLLSALRFLWQEGTSRERIVAAGSYYVEVDKALKGGGLAFRDAGRSGHGVPTQSYADRDLPNLEWTAEVPVAAGTALAWRNVLPHRFHAIESTADKGGPPACRTFLNFFVVDPQRPIVGPGRTLGALGGACNNRVDLGKKRAAAAMEPLLKPLPADVCREIASSFLPSSAQWASLDEAVAWRDRVRHALARAPAGGFAEVSCWGNSGDVKWVDSLEDAIYRQQRGGNGGRSIPLKRLTSADSFHQGAIMEGRLAVPFVPASDDEDEGGGGGGGGGDAGGGGGGDAGGGGGGGGDDDAWVHFQYGPHATIREVTMPPPRERNKASAQAAPRNVLTLAKAAACAARRAKTTKQAPAQIGKATWARSRPQGTQWKVVPESEVHSWTIGD